MFRSILLLNKGKVFKWIAHRGFGFIVEVGNSTSYFVHNESLKVPGGAFRALCVGQDVEFDVAKDDGAKAIDVTAVGGGLLSGGGCNEKDNKNQIKHDDPSTWPKNYSATDIETLFHAKVPATVVVSSEYVEFLHQRNYKDRLLDEIRRVTKTPPTESSTTYHIKHDDPSTWPKEFSATDIETFLRGKVHENVVVDYEFLEFLLRRNCNDLLFEEV